jgi:hypothetical protein
MRGGEGLVQVHVDDVEAHVAGAHPTQDGIEVGAVVVGEPTRVVDDALNVDDGLLEHPQGGRVGEHEPGRLWPHRLAQGREIDVALPVGWDLPYLIAAHDGGGGVGAMGGVRDDDLTPAAVAACLMIGADHGHAGELALGTGHRGERHPSHAADRLEYLLQLVQTREEALAGLGIGQRVARQELWQHGQRVAGARVVFHGAGAQGVELGVDGVVLLRQPGVMTHHVELGHLGQRRRRLAQQLGGQVVRFGGRAG